MTQSQFSLITANAIDGLKTLSDNSVHCIVTSPPYWGMRNYGTNPVDWGDWTGELGHEENEDAYIAHLLLIFSEARRVLRLDGTLWVNIGDTYYTNKGHRFARMKSGRNKDLSLIPWKFAMAMQADGWYVRSSIVWQKPTAMPESVRDRPTSSWEPIFMFSKHDSYYYDQCSITTEKGANVRNVWSMVPEQIRDAHFAPMPVELARRCIALATSDYGVCEACGSPFLRDIERILVENKWRGRSRKWTRMAKETGLLPEKTSEASLANGKTWEKITRGWKPQCECGSAIKPATVLDPFSGAGTTALAAMRLNRNAIGIDLLEEYNQIARKRIEKDASASVPKLL